MQALCQTRAFRADMFYKVLRFNILRLNVSMKATANAVNGLTLFDHTFMQNSQKHCIILHPCVSVKQFPKKQVQIQIA